MKAVSITASKMQSAWEIACKVLSIWLKPLTVTWRSSITLKPTGSLVSALKIHMTVLWVFKQNRLITQCLNRTITKLSYYMAALARCCAEISKESYGPYPRPCHDHCPSQRWGDSGNHPSQDNSFLSLYDYSRPGDHDPCSCKRLGPNTQNCMRSYISNSKSKYCHYAKGFWHEPYAPSSIVK